MSPASCWLWIRVLSSTCEVLIVSLDRSRGGLQKVFDSPLVIGQPLRHRGSLLQCRVLPAEIIPREVQGQHRFMVRPFFGVGIRQAGHATVSHADVEVHPFDVGGANHALVRVAASLNLVDAYYPRRGIPSRPVLVVALPVILHDLGEIHVRIEDVGNAQGVRPESVRGDLVAACRGVPRGGSGCR